MYTYEQKCNETKSTLMVNTHNIQIFAASYQPTFKMFIISLNFQNILILLKIIIITCNYDEFLLLRVINIVQNSKHEKIRHLCPMTFYHPQIQIQ